MARPLQLLLFVGLALYALSYTNKIFDRGWEKQAKTQHRCSLFVALLTRARRGGEQQREQRRRTDAAMQRARLQRELAALERREWPMEL